MVDPQDLLSLLNGEFSSLTIGFNDDHGPNYEVASEEWYSASNPVSGHISWVSEEERQKAIRENSVWTIQWHPETPVGFYCVGASTFEAAARAALAGFDDGKARRCGHEEFGYD